MTRAARHQARIKNAATQISVKLIYKYRARSLSELFDKCSADEFASLIYAAYDYQKYVLSALELFVKDCLDLQRRNRWEYLLSYAQYNEEQEKELLRLFTVQGVDPVYFGKSLKKVLNCEHPKINAIKIHGTPNSGKSLIGQLIASAFITCYCNNHGSENEFYLSNFLNKTFILCEELYVTKATCEDFKSVLGGANIDIAKKFHEKQILSRTPVLITSNHSSFGRGHLPPIDETALNARCIVFEFQAPFAPACQIGLPAFCHFLFLCLNQEMF